jgi:hypothetical protein
MKHAFIALAALIFGVGAVAHAIAGSASSGPLAALLSARQWLNTQPLRAEDLRGKVSCW